MSTINGIGTTLLGVSDQDEEHVATATSWFTILYLPIIPLKRLRVRFLPHKGSGYRYQILQQEPLHWGEIGKTYLAGWLLIPLLIFWPLPIAFAEVWAKLGFPQALYIPYMVFAILWAIVAIWRLAGWQDKRLRPN